jgi:hypothetical protein
MIYINVAVICRIALQWRRQWLNDGGGLERLEEAFGIQSMEPAETIYRSSNSRVVKSNTGRFSRTQELDFTMFQYPGELFRYHRLYLSKGSLIGAKPPIFCLRLNRGRIIKGLPEYRERLGRVGRGKLTGRGRHLR